MGLHALESVIATHGYASTRRFRKVKAGIAV